MGPSLSREVCAGDKVTGKPHEDTTMLRYIFGHRGHSDEVLDVAFHWNGQNVVTASSDSEVIVCCHTHINMTFPLLWPGTVDSAQVISLPAKSCIERLVGHTAEVSRVGLSRV